MNTNNSNNLLTPQLATTTTLGPIYYHDGTVVPELLTEDEALKFLRLDSNGTHNLKEALKHLREHHGLRPTRSIGRTLKYTKKELLRFLDHMTEKANGNGKK
jgi:hypothetical protein